MKKYYLMNKDNIVASACMEQGILGESLQIEKVSGTLPIGLTQDSLTQWVENRKASKHNHHLRELMKECHCDTLEGFIHVTHAASINDTFWIKGADEQVAWRDISLYQNDFDKTISRLAFEGLGIPDEYISSTSPELTTNGSFRKCFSKENGDIFLYKRGTSEAANAGLEPYCEIMSAEIAKRLCKDAVSYDLVTLHGEIASRCQLFTNEQYGYMPMAAYTRNATPEQLLQFMRNISEESEEEFRAMLVCDSIIFNIDRHLGNFGILIENDTVQPIGIAPIFDFNLSLFPYASEAELSNPGDMLLQYAPIIGNDFTRIGQQAMTDEIRKKVKELEGFQFTFRGNEKFPESRVRLLENIVDRQIEAVLSNEILQTKDVFIPINRLQKEQKTGEAEQRLDKAYDLLSGLNDFEISVIQDSDNQIICMESAEDPAGNPSVYIDFLHNTVRAEQDGIRISEQTLPQIYRNAIGAIDTYIGRNHVHENVFIMMCGIPGAGKTEKAFEEANAFEAKGITKTDAKEPYSIEQGILDLNSATYNPDTFLKNLPVNFDNRSDTYCIISPHDIREEIKRNGYKESEELTQILVRARIKIALAQGRNVIFDSTNTKKEIRMSYLAAAKEMKTGSCRLDLCLIPLAQHSPFVQTEICSSLYQNLQDNYPDMKEGWDKIEEINGKDRTNEIQQDGPDVRKESVPLDRDEW